MGYRAMLDLFGAVPHEEVGHGAVGVVLEPGVVQGEIAQDRGVVLKGGDQPQPLDEVLLLSRGRSGVHGAQDLSEDPFHLQLVGLRVDAVCVEPLPQHVIVGLGVHRLLSDESAHRGRELPVLHQRQRLVIGLDEPAFSLGQKEVQDADEIGRDGVVRNPVQGSPGPVELHVAGMQLDGAGVGVVVDSICVGAHGDSYPATFWRAAIRDIHGAKR